MYGGYGYNCGLGGWHFIIPTLIVGIIVYAIYKLSKNNYTENNIALNELNRKFINGEISEQDYNEKKSIISK